MISVNLALFRTQRCLGAPIETVRSASAVENMT